MAQRFVARVPFFILSSIAFTSGAVAAPRLRVQPDAAKAGDALLVTVSGVDEAPRGTAGGTSLQFYPVRGGDWQAVVAVPLEKSPGELKIEIAGTGLIKRVPVSSDNVFPEETVDVAPELAEPGAAARAQIDRDNTTIQNAMASDIEPRFDGRFTRPRGKASSTFGAWRTFNGGYRSQHLGLDIPARKRAPVRAVAAGTVTLIHEGFLTGKTVVVAHGGGIASVYFHLDEVALEAGNEVKKGGRLGAVGETGRTTGPHLHIGVHVPGGFVDPVSFFALPLARPAPAARASR